MCLLQVLVLVTCMHSRLCSVMHSVPTSTTVLWGGVGDGRGGGEDGRRVNSFYMLNDLKLTLGCMAEAHNAACEPATIS